MDVPATSVLDALAHPDSTAAWLANQPPHATTVEPLVALDARALTSDGQIDALLALDRHIALLQARAQELLAAIDVGDSSPDGFARDATAAALRLPPASVRTRMVVARELTGRLPATLAMLRSGAITQRHARDLADATRSLQVETARAVESRVLVRAPEQTPTQFRASVKRAVLRCVDAAEQEIKHRAAVAERRVVISPVDDGMAVLWAFLPADDAALVNASLNARAYETIHGKGGDTRTADQRRADALVELAAAALADDALVRGHGQKAAVQVTIAASTLMGLDDQPAELDGYGPITAAMARRIAADETATWRRLITDDAGRILSVSRRVYRPPAAIVAEVLARDAQCTFPGCRRSAKYNDLDHVRSYRPGDDTSAANLISLCRRHHRLKHSGRWQVDRDDLSGIVQWTDRRGRSHLVRPPELPTTTETAAATSAGPTQNRYDPDPPPF